MMCVTKCFALLCEGQVYHRSVVVSLQRVPSQQSLVCTISVSRAVQKARGCAPTWWSQAWFMMPGTMSPMEGWCQTWYSGHHVADIWLTYTILTATWHIQLANTNDMQLTYNADIYSWHHTIDMQLTNPKLWQFTSKPSNQNENKQKLNQKTKTNKLNNENKTKNISTH